MIIWIDGVVSDYSSPLANDVAEAIIELGESGYKGRNIVACGRPLARHFGALSDLSDRARAYFMRVYHEYTQLGAVFSSQVFAKATLSVVSPSFIGGVWNVPLSLFKDEEYSDSLHVVCENDVDFDVIRALASAWVRVNAAGCVLSAKSRAGHGGSTPSVIRRMAQDPNPVYLCVLDSDRKSFGGGEGSTARGVRNVWSDAWRADLHVLSCRELENAIPVQSLIRYYREARLDLDFLDEFSEVHENISDFICLKTGESPCRFHSVLPSHSGYAETRAGLSETARSHSKFRDCGDSCSGRSDCRIAPRLGEEFLAKFADWLGGRASVLPSLDSWSVDAVLVAEKFAKMALALPRRQ